MWSPNCHMFCVSPPPGVFQNILWARQEPFKIYSWRARGVSCPEHITIYSGQGPMSRAYHNILWAQSPVRSISLWYDIRIYSGQVSPTAMGRPSCWLSPPTWWDLTVVLCSHWRNCDTSLCSCPRQWPGPGLRAQLGCNGHNFLAPDD